MTSDRYDPRHTEEERGRARHRYSEHHGTGAWPAPLTDDAAPASASATGTAEQLLLFVRGRLTPNDLRIEGDRQVFERLIARESEEQPADQVLCCPGPECARPMGAVPRVVRPPADPQSLPPLIGSSVVGECAAGGPPRPGARWRDHRQVIDRSSWIRRPVPARSCCQRRRRS
ncbi:hypothetical protein B7767_26040 [Streptomyces sp. 13-12-16]|nr:hypothetical protein [Streptomyces sp. 13-12-16]OSP40484.1 hypothetical protein B7767_26040 [Streptomyces sp. 13-12-16]